MFVSALRNGYLIARWNNNYIYDPWVLRWLSHLKSFFLYPDKYKVYSSSLIGGITHSSYTAGRKYYRPILRGSTPTKSDNP